MTAGRPLALAALLALAIALPGARARAQTHDQVRSSVAVIATPVGGFPSVVTTPDRSRLGPGIIADFGVVSRLPVNRYGYGVSDVGLQSTVYGVSVEAPVGPVRVGGTIGEVTPRCGSAVLELCLRVRTAGGRVQGWLLRRAFGARNADGNSPYLMGVGLEGAAGAGWWRGVSLASLGVGVPLSVALNVRAPNWSSEKDPRFRPRTVFYLTPGLVHGSWGGAGFSSAGTFPSLTAGVSVLDIGPGFGITASAKRIGVPRSDLQVAFGLAWHHH